MEALEDAVSGVRNGFLSSGVFASAPNAYSERDDFEDGTSALAEEEAIIGDDVMFSGAAIAVSHANDNSLLNFITASGPTSHSEGGTDINLQNETCDLAPTFNLEELNSFDYAPPPSGYGLEKDHTDADKGLGLLLDNVSDLECQYKLLTAAVGSQTASGSVGCIRSSWTVPDFSEGSGIQTTPPVHDNGIDVNQTSKSENASRETCLPATPVFAPGQAAAAPVPEIAYSTPLPVAAVDSQIASGPVGSGIQTTPVQDVASRHDTDSGIGISQTSESESASQETFTSLSGTPALAPLDQAALQRIAHSTPLQNGEEFRTQYGSSWDPSTSIHPTPEYETDPIQRDGSDSQTFLSLSEAFAKRCEESGTSGKRKPVLRDQFIPSHIREGNIKVEREGNDAISLNVENYSHVANLWFIYTEKPKNRRKKKDAYRRKKKDAYDFRRALESTLGKFDKVIKINDGKGRKFVLSKNFIQYKELDKLIKASSSVANHEENDLPQATGEQDRVISSDTGAARGKTRRRQSRRTTYTHKQSSPYQFTPRPSMGSQSSSVSSIPSPAQVASRLDSIGNNLIRETEHASQETWESLMSGGPQAAVAVFQKIPYSMPLLHGEEYLRIQDGPSWDPAPFLSMLTPDCASHGEATGGGGGGQGRGALSAAAVAPPPGRWSHMGPIAGGGASPAEFSVSDGRWHGSSSLPSKRRTCQAKRSPSKKSRRN